MESAGRDRAAEKRIAGLFVAGWMAANVFLTMECILLPQMGNPKSPGAGRALDALWIAGMIGGPALVLTATALSLRTPRPSVPPTFADGYTFILILLGALGLAAAMGYELLIPTLSGRDAATISPILRFTQGHLLMLGVPTVGAGLLRKLRSRHAIPLTAAIHAPLLLWFPLGTAAAAWWFFRVRPKEDAAF